MRFRKQSSISKIVGYGSLGLLGMLALAILLPITPQPADAIDLTDGQSLAEHSTTTSVHIQSAISLALQDRIDLDIVPKSHGAFNSTTAEVAVATNNSTGYGIYLGTTNGSSALKFLGSNTSAEIAPVTGTVTAETFEQNTWGYCLNAASSAACSTYQAVPAETTQVENIPTHNVLTDKDTFNLSFAAKVDTSLPAGEYTNNLVVSVVANPREPYYLNELTYMQDMQTHICEHTPIGNTKQLIDLRDSKKYWVTKLADGNCWMTQNLDFDLKQNDVLTPADTDVRSDWTVPTTTESGIPESTTDYNPLRSFDMGAFVIATYIDVGKGCWALIDGTYKSRSMKPGDTLDLCINWQNVSAGWTPATTIVEYSGKAQYPYTGALSVDYDAKTYDAHYLVGNFYVPNTATAGSATALGAPVPSSICPKGWSLPEMTSDSEPTRSYANLLAKYGMTNKTSGTGTVPGITEGISYRAEKLPLYFGHFGRINLGLGQYQDVGSTGSYLIGYRAANSLFAYSFLYNLALNPTNSLGGDYAISVRCVAR